MGDGRADSLRALAAELEQRDEAVAREIALLVQLAEEAGAVRGRAVEIRDALEALPTEIAAIERAQVDAQLVERGARGELAEAERRREQIVGSRRATEEEKAAARRTAQDAREALADAEHRTARLWAQRTELLEAGEALRAEADGLAVAARSVATALRDAPRLTDAGATDPGTTLEEIDAWGAQARAALFVARGTLETERERIVAEANALGCAVLGEELGGTSVALVRQRVEAALR